MVNAQQWLKENFPDKTIKKLNINNKALKGHLKLTAYPKLEELYCRENQLTSLDLSNCSRLTKINCSNNELIDLNLSGCVNLKEIDCSDNKLTNVNFLTTLPCLEKVNYLDLFANPLQQTLDCFTSLTNLEYLHLKKTNIYGSMAPLAKLTNLKILDIGSTKLDSDLESLPANLGFILAEGMPEIAEKMKSFKEIEILGYNYQAWRKANSENIILFLQKNLLQKDVENKTLKAQLEALENPLQKKISKLEQFIGNSKETLSGEALQTKVSELCQAVEEDKIDKVEELLAAYSNIANELDENGFTALHYAAVDGSKKAAKMLLKKGANPNAKTKENENTALHYAARNGHYKLLKLLVNNPYGSRGDINVVNKHNSSILHSAAWGIVEELGEGSWDIIKFLLKKKIDTKIKDDDDFLVEEIFYTKDYSYQLRYEELKKKLETKLETQALTVSYDLRK